MFTYLILFLGGFFLKTKPRADLEISKREGREIICLGMVYFKIILAKRGR